MIKADRGITEIAGSLAEIMAETALILTNVYVIPKGELGEADARKMIVEIGRAAMADKTIAEVEKERHHWKEKYEKGGRE